VTFRFPARPKWDSLVLCSVQTGSAAGLWSPMRSLRSGFTFNELPLAKMWADARLWVPRVLAGDRREHLRRGLRDRGRGPLRREGR
jgi:hypothetical protein